MSTQDVVTSQMPASTSARACYYCCHLTKSFSHLSDAAALLLLLLTTETTLNCELLCAVKEETQASLRAATLEKRRKIPATENFLVNHSCDEDEDLSHKLLEQSSDDDDEMICNCYGHMDHD